MEQFVVNAASRSRTVKEGSKTYLVVPMTMLRPQVLNGSKGPLYYPPGEIVKSVAAWNRVPLTLNHPTHPDGRPASSRDPGVAERLTLGEVRNPHIIGLGKLRAEGWFDAERTKRIAPDVYNALKAHRPVELSTGLFTDNEIAQNGSSYLGKAYSHVARNYRPDHLAILPNQKGACGIQDGCGVLVNHAPIQKTCHCEEVRIDNDALARMALTELTGNTFDEEKHPRGDGGRFAESTGHSPQEKSLRLQEMNASLKVATKNIEDRLSSLQGSVKTDDIGRRHWDRGLDALADAQDTKDHSQRIEWLKNAESHLTRLMSRLEGQAKDDVEELLHDVRGARIHTQQIRHLAENASSDHWKNQPRADDGRFGDTAGDHKGEGFGSRVAKYVVEGGQIDQKVKAAAAQGIQAKSQKTDVLFDTYHRGGGKQAGQILGAAAAAGGATIAGGVSTLASGGVGLGLAGVGVSAAAALGPLAPLAAAGLLAAGAAGIASGPLLKTLFPKTFDTLDDVQKRAEIAMLLKRIFAVSTLGAGPIAVEAARSALRHSPSMFRLLLKGAKDLAGGGEHKEAVPVGNWNPFQRRDDVGRFSKDEAGFGDDTPVYPSWARDRESQELSQAVKGVTVGLNQVLETIDDAYLPRAGKPKPTPAKEVMEPLGRVVGISNRGLDALVAGEYGKAAREFRLSLSQSQAVRDLASRWYGEDDLVVRRIDRLRSAVRDALTVSQDAHEVTGNASRLNKVFQTQPKLTDPAAKDLPPATRDLTESPTGPSDSTLPRPANQETQGKGQDQEPRPKDQVPPSLKLLARALQAYPAEGPKLIQAMEAYLSGLGEDVDALKAEARTAIKEGRPVKEGELPSHVDKPATGEKTLPGGKTMGTKKPFPPRPTMNVTDAQGHEHDEKGKFTSGGGGKGDAAGLTVAKGSGAVTGALIGGVLGGPLGAAAGAGIGFGAAHLLGKRIKPLKKKQKNPQTGEEESVDEGAKGGQPSAVAQNPQPKPPEIPTTPTKKEEEKPTKRTGVFSRESVVAGNAGYGIGKGIDSLLGTKDSFSLGGSALGMLLGGRIRNSLSPVTNVTDAYGREHDELGKYASGNGNARLRAIIASKRGQRRVGDRQYDAAIVGKVLKASLVGTGGILGGIAGSPLGPVGAGVGVGVGAGVGYASTQVLDKVAHALGRLLVRKKRGVTATVLEPTGVPGVGKVKSSTAVFTKDQKDRDKAAKAFLQKKGHKAAASASKDALTASAKAKTSADKKDHDKAAVLHARAATLHKALKEPEIASLHERLMKIHKGVGKKLTTNVVDSTGRNHDERGRWAKSEGVRRPDTDYWEGKKPFAKLDTSDEMDELRRKWESLGIKGQTTPLRERRGRLIGSAVGSGIGTILGFSQAGPVGAAVLGGVGAGLGGIIGWGTSRFLQQEKDRKQQRADREVIEAQERLYWNDRGVRNALTNNFIKLSFGGTHVESKSLLGSSSAGHWVNQPRDSHGRFSETEGRSGGKGSRGRDEEGNEHHAGGQARWKGRTARLDKYGNKWQKDDEDIDRLVAVPGKTSVQPGEETHVKVTKRPDGYYRDGIKLAEPDGSPVGGVPQQGITPSQGKTKKAKKGGRLAQFLTGATTGAVAGGVIGGSVGALFGGPVGILPGVLGGVSKGALIGTGTGVALGAVGGLTVAGGQAGIGGVAGGAAFGAAKIAAAFSAAPAAALTTVAGVPLAAGVALGAAIPFAGRQAWQAWKNRGTTSKVQKTPVVPAPVPATASPSVAAANPQNVPTSPLSGPSLSREHALLVQESEARAKIAAAASQKTQEEAAAVAARLGRGSQVIGGMPRLTEEHLSALSPAPPSSPALSSAQVEALLKGPGPPPHNLGRLSEPHPANTPAPFPTLSAPATRAELDAYKNAAEFADRQSTRASKKGWGRKNKAGMDFKEQYLADAIQAHGTAASAAIAVGKEEEARKHQERVAALIKVKLAGPTTNALIFHQGRFVTIPALLYSLRN